MNASKTPTPIKILLVEDNPGDARLITHMLSEARGLAHELEWVDNLTAGIERLATGKIDIALLDLELPESYGLDTLRRLQAQLHTMPTLVVLSGFDDEDSAVQAVQFGAQDYLIKGTVDSALLVRSIRYAMERSQAREALRQAHGELEKRVVERTAELQHAMQALHEEIKERKQAEELLRKREQEFRTLAENLPDIVVRYGRDLQRVYVNPAYEQATGLPLSEVLGELTDMTWLNDMPLQEFKEKLRQVMETGVAMELFLKGTRADGQSAHHALNMVAEYDPNGKVAGVLAIGRNVTALKEAERRLKESQYQLRQLAARSEAIREDERKYLTREIHDELGQHLSALRLGVSVIELQFGDGNPLLQEKTASLIKLVDATIKVVRNIVASLRPAALDMGIASALEWLVDEFIARTRLQCVLHVRDSDIQLDEKRATGIFRIVQESLTNIGRHAEASAVEIVLDKNEWQYLLEVRDNGKGFDPAVRNAKSFGLIGIRERALMLEGEIDLSSTPGKGTTIKVCFPIQNPLAEP